MMPELVDLYGLTRANLGHCLIGWGYSPVHAARLWKYLYHEKIESLDAAADLPARLRERLMSGALLPPLSVAAKTESSDGLTTKFLLELADGQRVETVLMHFRGRVTACLSSQVGCALGCVFCATGQMGFERNLSTGEIIAQAMHVQRVLLDSCPREMPNSNWRLKNIVLMGMGEPLLNYDAVMTAVEILSDPGGLAIGGKQLTLSTVGVIPGIIRLADEARSCSLAVSLHAASQEEREKMIPSAKTWPLDELMEACRFYTAKLRRKIFFEWTVIEGENDSSDHASALADLVLGIPCQINLIPLNPTAAYAGKQPTDTIAETFRLVLQDRGIPSTIRQRRGIDIAAGCGQLATV